MLHNRIEDHVAQSKLFVLSSRQDGLSRRQLVDTKCKFLRYNADFWCETGGRYFVKGSKIAGYQYFLTRLAMCKSGNS